MRLIGALIVFLLVSGTITAQEERVYEFDLLAIDYVTPITAKGYPSKSYMAINSQDNSYQLYLQIDLENDEVELTMIDNKEGWYNYSTMAWSAFDQTEVTIVLKRRNLSRSRRSKQYKFDFTASGIRDTLISDKTFKSFRLEWTKKNRELQYCYVIDTTYTAEVPNMSAELFSSNVELLEQIPNGRFESVLVYKDGDALTRTDNLDYVPIAVKVVVK
ncbi:hypothetical protein [Gilvibacter sp.]|uniref:hypothetical protein n=1 Tax=Gilvibacter sp. TaxID=2729997 RepID=UPI0035BE68FE